MDDALGAEAEALLADGHVAREAAVEILCGRFGDPRVDAVTQCLADVDVLTRDAKRHDRPPRNNPPRRFREQCQAGDSDIWTITRERQIAIHCTREGYSTHAELCAASGRRAQHRSASRAGAAPRTESASPRDTWRRFAGRCRCRPSRSISTMVSSDSTWSGVLGIDQLPDAMAHRFGRMRLAAVGRRDRRGEEVLQFEDAAAGRHVFVGGDARHGRFVHADRVGDGLEIERPQMLDAVGEERVLLAHDLGRDLEDGLGALVERADQPGGGLQAVGEIALVLVALRRPWRPRRNSSG